MSNVISFPGNFRVRQAAPDPFDDRFQRFLIKRGLARPILMPDERYWPQRETVPAVRRQLEGVA